MPTDTPRQRQQDGTRLYTACPVCGNDPSAAWCTYCFPRPHPPDEPLDRTHGRDFSPEELEDEPRERPDPGSYEGYDHSNPHHRS